MTGELCAANSTDRELEAQLEREDDELRTAKFLSHEAAQRAEIVEKRLQTAERQAGCVKYLHNRSRTSCPLLLFGGAVVDPAGGYNRQTGFELALTCR